MLWFEVPTIKGYVQGNEITDEGWRGDNKLCDSVKNLAEGRGDKRNPPYWDEENGFTEFSCSYKLYI